MKTPNGNIPYMSRWFLFDMHVTLSPWTEFGFHRGQEVLRHSRSAEGAIHHYNPHTPHPPQIPHHHHHHPGFFPTACQLCGEPALPLCCGSHLLLTGELANRKRWCLPLQLCTCISERKFTGFNQLRDKLWACLGNKTALERHRPQTESNTGLIRAKGSS